MTTLDTATKTGTQTGTLMPPPTPAPKPGAQGKTGPQEKRGGAGLKASAPICGDNLNFLIDEAALFHHHRHVEWLECLTDDIVYQMPVRKTVYRRNGDG